MGKERKKSIYTPEQIEEIKRARAQARALAKERQAEIDAKKAEYRERLKEKQAEVKMLLDEMLYGEEVGMADAELTAGIKKALSAGGVELLPESKLAISSVYSGHTTGFDLYEVMGEGASIRHPQSSIDRVRVNYVPFGTIERTLGGAIYEQPRVDVQRFIVFGGNGSTITIDATQVIPNMMDRLNLTAGLAKAFLPQETRV